MLPVALPGTGSEEPNLTGQSAGCRRGTKSFGSMSFDAKKAKSMRALKSHRTHPHPPKYEKLKRPFASQLRQKHHSSKWGHRRIQVKLHKAQTYSSRVTLVHAWPRLTRKLGAYFPINRTRVPARLLITHTHDVLDKKDCALRPPTCLPLARLSSETGMAHRSS